jgi:hypothetical protein
MEILFDLNISVYYYDLINSRTLAQIILCGISFKPILYFIILFPSKILFKFKCYTSITLDSLDGIDSVNQQDPHLRQRLQGRYSLNLHAFYPKYRRQLRTLSTPTIITQNCQNISNIELE